MANNTEKPSNDVKAGENDAHAKEARIRAVAMQHALNIQEKKKLQNKVLDTIITAFDLPCDKSSTAAKPTDLDAAAFRQCLFLFRPSDLDEVVSERNIDHRCGYALCRNANGAQKSSKVWDNKKNTMIDKVIGGKYCSDACNARNSFVREQLSTEPAWLRHGQNTQVRLLSDAVSQASIKSNGDAIQSDERARQEALALERGDTYRNNLDDVTVIEKETTTDPQPPQNIPEITVSDILEGLPIRTSGNRETRQNG